MTPRAFRARTVTVLAVQWDGDPPDEATDTEIVAWIKATGGSAHVAPACRTSEPAICIHGSIGHDLAHPGDWIVHSNGIGFRAMSPLMFDGKFEEIV